LAKNLHREDILEILETAGVEFLAGGVMLGKAGRAEETRSSPPRERS